MKKLLALVLAVVMCTAALLTFVSAEDVAVGTKFDLTGKTKAPEFSFGMIEGIPDASKFVAFESNKASAGINSDLGATGLGNMYWSGNEPTKFGWGNPDSGKMLYVNTVGLAHCYAAGYNVKVIAFTAPVDGTYTMTATSISFSGAYVSTSVNGAEFNKLNSHVGGAGTPDTINHTETFSLKAGQVYYIALGRASSSDAGDIVTMQLDDLTITLDKLGYTAPDVETEVVVYDFVKAFAKKNLDGSNFSLKMNHTTHGMQETTTKWYDGDDASVTNAAMGGALVGFATKNEAGHHVDIAAHGSEIIWYTASDLENVICFTAPEDGVYAYDFETSALWTVEHSTLRFYVKAGDKVLNEVQYSKDPKTSVPDSMTNFEGSLTLKAGETIFFVADPEDSSAGDNCKLIKLQVSLTEKLDLPDDPTVGPGEDVDPPKTNDALVAVIALAAVAGTALVISKKH